MWSGPWLCGKYVMLLASASSANHATASALWSVSHAALPPVLACLPHGELWWSPLLHQQMVPGKALLFLMAANSYWHHCSAHTDFLGRRPDSANMASAVMQCATAVLSD